MTDASILEDQSSQRGINNIPKLQEVEVDKINIRGLIYGLCASLSYSLS
jgi:hypothetical protein